ncbi:MAG TPA: hypothetical protein DCQ94_04020 [Nitrospira sp.]|jgi:translation initiation factor IF-1|nr:hypothetical protein [Nitrospira sp.]
MTMRILMAVALISAGFLAPVLGFQTAAVFPVSWVEHVDHRNHVLTFKTEDGQVRMMRVADRVAMRREGLRQGDLVSIEVDLDDQIVNIVKVDRRAESDRPTSRRK